MQLLIWLTLGYAAVLVVAVATSLILILVHLWRIRTALQPISDALRDVGGRTEGIGQLMAGLDDTISAMQREIAQAADAVERGGDVLGITPPGAPIFQAHAAAEWQGKSPWTPQS